MNEPLPLIDAALRGGLVALLLLLAWRLARDLPRAPAARVGVCFMLGLCVQAISSTPAFERSIAPALQAPWVGISVGNSVLFWIFTSSLFDDDFQLRPRHAVAWGGVFALGLAQCLVIGPALEAGHPLRLAIGIGMRWVPMVFAVLAVAAALRRWRDDLVEQRLWLRWFIVVAGSTYTLAMVAARLMAPGGRLEPGPASLDVAALGLIVAVVAMRALRLSESELMPPAAACDAVAPAAPAAHAPPADSASPAQEPAGELHDEAEDQRWELALHKLMTAEKAYRDDDLSVARLSDRLGLPEYRLRRLINQRLGYRNFNAYINTFRVEDARRALADPAQREQPVLHIALEAGFQSIGPFNRAFKAHTGLTPTEFRRQATPALADLADS